MWCFCHCNRNSTTSFPTFIFSKREAIPNGFVFLRQKEPFLQFNFSVDVNRSHHESQIDSSEINVKYLYFICHVIFIISDASAVASSALRTREVAGSSPTMTIRFFPAGGKSVRQLKKMHAAGIEPATPGSWDLRDDHYAKHADAYERC